MELYPRTSRRYLQEKEMKNKEMQHILTSKGKNKQETVLPLIFWSKVVEQYDLGRKIHQENFSI